MGRIKQREQPRLAVRIGKYDKPSIACDEGDNCIAFTYYGYKCCFIAVFYIFLLEYDGFAKNLLTFPVKCSIIIKLFEINSV